MKKPDTFTIVNTILRRGNEPGLISEWFAGMKAWAEANGGQDAAALKIWLDLVKPRPFYTAFELSKLWPALRLTLGLTSRMEEPPSPNRLANELKFFGLPVLKNTNGKSFFFHGGNSSPAEHFIVEHCHKWRGQSLDQIEFDNIYFGNSE
jgi:hypothetical protein